MTNLFRLKFSFSTFLRRQSNSTRLQILQNAAQITDPRRIRNIGIIAHIDAGKTTTVERMLFDAGFIRSMGNVDDGNTTMDYMDQERERGITITSAAITIPWNKNRINLIDTPGHVDFTIEVERSLRVLDGAVTILDGSAGVETQSLTVWRQANRYNLPRLIYINKLDKPAANLSMCLDSIREKFHVEPIVLQKAIGRGKEFSSIVDLIGNSSDERNKLIECLAELDDSLAEKFLFNEKTITNEDLISTIRRLLNNGKKQNFVPVFLGSSLKNVGVRALLDGIVNFLPSAHVVPSSDGSTLIYIFKTIHDRQKQALSFARIYSGSVKRKMAVVNGRNNVREQIQKVFLPFADNMEEIDEIRAGSIAVLSGFKEASTGDILFGNAKSDFLAQIEKLREKYFFLPSTGLEPPAAVFFCTIETESERAQKHLELALKNLKREDPSLRTKVDEQTGQLILLGMGELHIDIVQDRLKREYGLETYLGPLNVNFRETIRKSNQQTIVWNSHINERQAAISVTLSLEPIPVENGQIVSFEQVQLVRTDEQQFEFLRKEHLDAINHGVRTALSTGILKSVEVVNVDVKLHDIQLSGSISAALYSAAASDCIRACLKNAESIVLQPMMRVEVICVADRTQLVLDDLARRHSEIVDVQHGIPGDVQQSMSTIVTRTPLAELIGYSSTLRTLTSGQADFTLSVSGYEPSEKY